MGLDAYGFVSCWSSEHFVDSFVENSWASLAEIYFSRQEAREFYRIFTENHTLSFVNRGIPKDSAGIVLSKYLWWVNPNVKQSNAHYITFEDAEKEINLNPDTVFWWNEEKKAIYSSHHFDTWLSSKEVDFLAHQTTLVSLSLKLRGVIGMMQALSEDVDKTRFLLWID